MDSQRSWFLNENQFIKDFLIQTIVFYVFYAFSADTCTRIALW